MLLVRWGSLGNRIMLSAEQWEPGGTLDSAVMECHLRPLSTVAFLIHIACCISGDRYRSSLSHSAWEISPVTFSPPGPFLPCWLSHSQEPP